MMTSSLKDYEGVVQEAEMDLRRALCLGDAAFGLDGRQVQQTSSS